MKLISLLSFLLLVINLSDAQSTSLGVFGGPNFSSLRFGHDYQFDGKESYLPGYVFGGNFTYNFNKRFGLRVEIMLQKKGGGYASNWVHVDGAASGPSNIGENTSLVQTPNVKFTTVKDHFTYIELPLLFQVGLGKKERYLLHLGQSLGYRIKRVDDYSNNMPVDLAKLDHSLIAGVVFAIPINEKISLHIMGRYIFGLKNIGTVKNMLLKHLAFSGMLGIQYYLYKGLRKR